MRGAGDLSDGLPAAVTARTTSASRAPDGADAPQEHRLSTDRSAPTARDASDPGAATRARIIAAAIEVIAEDGLRASTVAIAERAGLTRMTLYRHVGGRDELLVVVLLHESARLVPGLRAVLEHRRRRFPRRVADAIELLVDGIHANPVLRQFVDQPPPTTVPAIDPQFTFVTEVRAFFRPYFEDPDNRSQLRFDPERTLDYTLRQLLLYLTTPGRDWTGPADLRADLDDFFIPAIARPRPARRSRPA